MVTREYLLSLGFKELGKKEKDIYYTLNLKPKNLLRSLTSLSGSFVSKPDNRFYLYGLEPMFSECTKERLDEIIKGIELINGCSLAEITE